MIEILVLRGPGQRSTALALTVASVLHATQLGRAAQNDTVTIRASYSYFVDRIRPERQSGISHKRNLIAVLSGAKNIEERWGEQTPRHQYQSPSRRVLGGSAS